MRRSLALFLAAVLAAPAATAVLPGTAPVASAEPGAASVAVVDMLKLINAHPDFKRAKDTLDQKLKAADSARKAAEDQLKLDEQQLEKDFPRDHPQRPAAEKALQQRRITAKFDWEWTLKLTQDEYMRSLISIHGKVVGFVAQYARANKISLVLQMTNEPVTGKSPDEFIPNVVVRSVVHFDDALDITAAVMKTFPPAPPAPAEPAPAGR
jgi:Skp family chaperone for outer membrane proteins